MSRERGSGSIRQIVDLLGTMHGSINDALTFVGNIDIVKNGFGLVAYALQYIGSSVNILFSSNFRTRNNKYSKLIINIAFIPLFYFVNLFNTCYLFVIRKNGLISDFVFSLFCFLTVYHCVPLYFVGSL